MVQLGSASSARFGFETKVLTDPQRFASGQHLHPAEEVPGQDPLAEYPPTNGPTALSPSLMSSNVRGRHWALTDMPYRDTV
jgi:hypothetical protein